MITTHSTGVNSCNRVIHQLICSMCGTHVWNPLGMQADALMYICKFKPLFSAVFDEVLWVSPWKVKLFKYVYARLCFEHQLLKQLNTMLLFSSLLQLQMLQTRTETKTTLIFRIPFSKCVSNFPAAHLISWTLEHTWTLQAWLIPLTVSQTLMLIYSRGLQGQSLHSSKLIETKLLLLQ